MDDAPMQKNAMSRKLAERFARFIEPAVNAMATQFIDVNFAKIDVDELSAMPTFGLLKKGKEVDRVIGAKKDELEKKIKKYHSL
ncbi:hypothetical protein GBA52_002341 [Prunus armeniaca]|nr:hypothetical protein GBA52_002341 [Prunus armeniaca]